MNTMGVSVVGFAIFSLAFQVTAYATVVAVVSMGVVVAAGSSLLRTSGRVGVLTTVGALLWILSASAVEPLFRHAASLLASVAFAGALPSRTSDW